MSTSLTTLSGRTVLITGHSGFIGSWLSVLLAAAGTRVVGYSLSDDAVSSARAGWLERRAVVDVRGDVRNLRTLLETVRVHRPDLLVHLAAQPILRTGFVEPHRTFDVNINGSLSVLEAVRSGSVPALVHVTSDKCYAPTGVDSPPLTELSPIGGTGPYPASKSIAELLFGEFDALMPPGAAIASVRLGNVIGGGDEADRLTPNALRAFGSGRPFAVRDPAARRPFQHVLDVVSGLSQLAAGLLDRRVVSGLALNFAPPTAGELTADLVAELARAWGPDATVGDAPVPTDFPEQLAVRLDGSRAAALLGWEHRLDLRDAASWTVAWARMRGRGADPADVTARQTQEFLDLPVGVGARARSSAHPAADGR
ncbi:NAD-dependent epimerase/dehydratase family protein [Pseudonocardia sp. KRD-184]|uniref:NAD-dependent epimerase/dehydratase family protein n=1 Tax=Pseudonocardia oceani TaxID=2792013 RepID=A0ABS6UJY9_9PSEU|nr:NAD-dependent epimerase/dehydratase family protein [Pseudonocardia oceani]MBW0088609.1 NAD-dependent epimerase/dehydratase family protein [Pseudonocardia oceani]MBW0095452.1 NAD-dependent epimerase/dehydratase family protein [Pseudonocardia oceani]MBW0109049.1 NAD-dependent epimerase/dehydratase family protein [Pseudonocardia oceani]MBW0120026.1 NAD-dependent epimerase/dehydratase family protein [Pseudonocardia oceani]MBW0132482.1 NAD-dependent epimerase/dehydratase family protein [Pseudono